MWAPPVAARPHFSCLDTSDHTKRTWRGLQRVNILNVLIFEILKYSIFVVLLSKIETLYMPYHSKVKRGNRWTVDTYPS